MNRPLSTGVLRCLSWALALTASAAWGQATPRPTVAINVSSLSDSAAKRVDALALETRVVQRLLQEGFAVVAPFAEPDVLLSLEGSGERIRLVASGGGEPNVVEVTLAVGSLAELQLELSQRLVDLARAQLATFPPLSAEAASTPAPEQRPTLTPLIPRADAQGLPESGNGSNDIDLGLQVAVGVDALWRGDRLDPLARIVVEAGDRWSLRVAAGLAPSVVPGLEVWDWQLQAGPAFRLWQAGPLSAKVGVLVGVAYHDWTVDPSANIKDDEPVRLLDPFVSADLELSYRLTRLLQLGVRMAPGFTPRRLEHRTKTTDGLLLWGSEAARLESGLFLAGGF
ncbi:MAG: hypothetical protein WBV82_23975 [Myxococcaceae bacterium]